MFRRIALAFAFLFAAATFSALAQTATEQPQFLAPPILYDHPYLGGGGTAVRYFPKAEMHERCSQLAGKTLPILPAECGKWRWVRDGKFLPVGTRDTAGAVKRCFVYITARFQGTPTADLLFRHGRGHCNGWRHATRTGQTGFLSEDLVYEVDGQLFITSHDHEEGEE